MLGFASLAFAIPMTSASYIEFRGVKGLMRKDHPSEESQGVVNREERQGYSSIRKAYKHPDIYLRECVKNLQKRESFQISTIEDDPLTLMLL